MNLPLISIIVPVYKVEAYLARCVDSLLAQTYPNIEILLVDDGSPDRCGVICDEYAAKHPHVHAIHKENGGLSSARNAGIDAASGEYLGFVDSDDWVEPDFYESMYALAVKYDVPLVYAGRFDYSAANQTETVGMCPVQEEVISGQELVRRIFRWENVDSAAWDKLYRRELFKQIRYPLGITSEDVPTTYRLALLAGKAAACPRPFYHYFHRINSISYSSVSEKSLRHVSQCEAIEIDIQEHCPALATEAHYLKTRTLGYTLLSLNIADSALRKKFAAELRSFGMMMRRELPFVYSCGMFTSKEKRDYTLMAFDLYRLPRAVFHAMKGERSKS